MIALRPYRLLIWRSHTLSQGLVCVVSTTCAIMTLAIILPFEYALAHVPRTRHGYNKALPVNSTANQLPRRDDPRA